MGNISNPNRQVTVGKLKEFRDSLAITTLAAAPTSSTLSYTKDNKVHKFIVGDEVRVADQDAEEGYKFYKLYDITGTAPNQEAVWGELGAGGSGGSFKGTIIASLQTIVNDLQTSGADLAGVVVTLTDTTDSENIETIGTKTLAAGETSATFSNLTPLKNYQLSVSAISGYTTPQAVDINNLGLGARETKVMKYEADEYTVSITSNQGASDAAIASAKVTISGTQLSNGGTIKVAKGTDIGTPTATDITNYAKSVTVSGKTVTVAYSATVISINMVKVDEGIESGFPTGATATVKYSGGADQVLSSNSETAKVPTGTAFTVEYSPVSGYGTPATYSATAAGTAMTADKAQYISGVVQIEISANDGDDTALADAKAFITIGSGSEQELTGTMDTANHKKQFSISVNPGVTYSIRLGSITGYATPDVSSYQNVTKADGVTTIALTYNTEAVTVTVGTDQSGVTAQGQNITVNGTVYTVDSTGVITAKVPFGTQYSVSADAKSGYTTPATQTFTAGQVSRAVAVTYAKINLGIFAYYSDGSLKDLDHADSSAIGVAVLTSNAKFVIDKANVSGDTKTFGGYNVDMSSIGVVVTTGATTAKADFKGAENTTKIINKLGSSSAPAAAACRAAFGGVGYLGACGEWNEAYVNKSAVNSMMAKIGGTAITESYYWTSTLYNASANSWVLDWDGGYTVGSSRSYDYYVRAFRAL